MVETHAQLPGSSRPVAEKSRRIGPADASEKVEVMLTLRGPELPQPAPDAAMDLASLERIAGADPADVEAVRRTLEPYGLLVTAVSPATCSMTVSGTVAACEKAFGVSLGMYSSPYQGKFRARSGEISVPTSLQGIVTGVFGLDERQMARRGRSSVLAQRTGPKPQTPADLEQRYAFPAGNGVGQHIAIAEFGGAYLPDDLVAFATKFQRPVPDVHLVSAGGRVLTVDQVRALPRAEQQQVLEISVEVMMDVEIIAALCPAADITVYFAPFSQKGWIDLIESTMRGQVPVALSISWGMPEDSSEWSAAALREIDKRLQMAALMGITVVVASGDDGASAQLRDGAAHVNYPASSPFVLAVGGTQLAPNGAEVVWWEAPGERRPEGGGSTGGGVSVKFARPAWQDVVVAPINQPSIDGRVVPDVAALAGPPDYDLVFLGSDMPNGGTSASAPLWAALIARIAAGLPAPKQRRFLTPLLYRSVYGGGTVGSSGCHDIVTGNNDTPSVPEGFPATPGFDACAGWGTPQGSALARLLA